MKQSNVLIVDDNPHILESLKQLLKDTVSHIDSLSKPEQIPKSLESKSYDLILLDMNFKGTVNTGNEGLFWLRHIKQISLDQKVIMMTAFGDIDLAVRSVKEGAVDFLTKPWDPDTLIEKVQSNLLKQRKSSSSKESPSETVDLIGESKSMTLLNKMIRQVAPTDANILITGENGTGKNLVAEMIHRYSLRKKFPMVSVDLGSINENLFESELFGHKKGSFSGAISDKTGYLELSNGGTLFLDEIANLSLSLQQKLLRVLQERKVSKLGSEMEVSIDFRLICATNANMKKLLDEGLFREDLFYRISTIELESPPLRERDEDIILLAKYFFKKFTSRYNKEIRQINESTLKRLGTYSWPGNIRQLEHFMEKSVILCDGSEIIIEDLPYDRVLSDSLDNITNIEELEKKLIQKIVRKNNGNLTSASKELGISRSTLYIKIDKYDI